MWQHSSGCNVGNIGLIRGSPRTHTQREREKTRSRQEACMTVFVFMNDFWTTCTQIGACVDRWCDIRIHPFRSPQTLDPGGKRRQPCKGISLYSSLPALPFLFSLFPKHYSCRANKRVRGKEREAGSNLHCKNRQQGGAMAENETKRSTNMAGL